MPDPLFGLLILDRDPFTFADFPGLFQAWCSEAGGFVFAGLVIFLLYAMFGAKSPSAKERLHVPSIMLFAALAALFCYVGYSTEAPSTCNGAPVSIAGEAFITLPPSVPRLRVDGEPTSALPSDSPGYWAVTSWCDSRT